MYETKCSISFEGSSSFSIRAHRVFEYLKYLLTSEMKSYHLDRFENHAMFLTCSNHTSSDTAEVSGAVTKFMVSFFSRLFTMECFLLICAKAYSSVTECLTEIIHSVMICYHHSFERYVWSNNNCVHYFKNECSFSHVYVCWL